MPYIKNIYIKDLFGSKDIDLKLKDVTVLVGKNGSGKSTILNIIRSLLLNQDSDYFDRCSSAEIEFDGGKKINMSFVVKQQQYDDVYNKIMSEISNISDNSDNSKKYIDFIESFSSVMSSNLKKRFSNKHFECEYNHELNVEFISTINLSANSFLNVTSSEGISKRILDTEIEAEFEKISLLHKKVITKLCNKINEMLSDSNKMIFYRKKKNKNDFLFASKDNYNPKIYTIDDLSSGERQLIYILVKVATTNNKPTILLMDEPEISLHLGWQEKILQVIKELNDKCQILVVTHSPAIIMDGWMDSYIDIQDIGE